MARFNTPYYNHEGYPDPTAFGAFRNIDQQTRAAGRSPNYRPLVYICSPYAGDTIRNVLNAQRYSRMATERGYIPLAPHLLFPQFLNDSLEEERNLGLFMGLVLLTKCVEVWVFGAYISEGMDAEISKAKARGMPIRCFTENCEEAI